MTLVIHDDKVPIRIEENGAVRVGPTRVTLAVFLDSFKSGLGAEEMALNYPSIPLADIYSVIGYYLNHRDELDAWLNEHEIHCEEIRKKIEASQPGMMELRERIMARWAVMKAQNATIPSR